MGKLDKYVDASFKKADDGKLIYYPYTTLGPKYILSKESEAHIRIFLKIYYIFALVMPLLFVISGHIALAFITLILIISLYLIGISIMLSVSEKTEVKL